MLLRGLSLPRPKAAATQVSVSAHGGEAFLGFCFRRSRWLRQAAEVPLPPDHYTVVSGEQCAPP